MHVFEAPTGLSMCENGHVFGGLVCNMEKLKIYDQRAWTTDPSGREGSYKRSIHPEIVISGWGPRREDMEMHDVDDICDAVCCNQIIPAH
jgi:hypothetical protein